MPYLDDWTKFMLAQGRSQETIRRYRYALHRLAGDSNKDSLLEITETDVTTFLASLGKRAAARQLYLQAFRSFFPWAVERKLMSEDPSRYLRPKAPSEPEPDAFTPEEIVLLLCAARRRNPRRAWAIQAAYAMGLRRSELCGIRAEDIDWQGRRVYIREAKGDRPRWVEMNEIAEEALKALLNDATVRLHGNMAGGALVDPAPSPIPLPVPSSMSAHGYSIVGYAPQWFTMIVHQAAAEAGFPPGRRNAHLLRSSFATHLLGKGVPISVVSKLLGHMRVSTTGRYLAVREEDRRKAVDSLSLRVSTIAELEASPA